MLEKYDASCRMKQKGGKLLTSQYMLNMNLFNVFLVKIHQKMIKDKKEIEQIVGETYCKTTWQHKGE